MSRISCHQGYNVVPLSRALTKSFDDFIAGSLPTARAWTGRPQVDIVEEDSRILLIADMPGLEKKDIRVTVRDGLLSIEGNRSEVREEKAAGYGRSERFVGTFERSFRLPRWADGSLVTADYKNGVLTVTIPKTEQAKPKEVDITVN